MTQSKLRFFRLWFGLGLVACAVIAYASLIPNPPQPVEIAYFDKIEHFGAYCILGAWFGAILPGCYLRIFIALTICGAAIEVLQSMTGYRSGDVLDMVADMAGIGAGFLLAGSGLMRWLNYVDQHAFPKRKRT